MSNRNWRDQKNRLARKKRLYERDQGKCQIGYCGGVDLSFEDATLDHIIPYSHNGPTTDENLQLACRECNALKANLYECPCGLPPAAPGCRGGIERAWIRYCDALELRMLYEEWKAGLLPKLREHWSLPLDELEEFRKSRHEEQSS